MNSFWSGLARSGIMSDRPPSSGVRRRCTSRRRGLTIVVDPGVVGSETQVVESVEVIILAATERTTRTMKLQSYEQQFNDVRRKVRDLLLQMLGKQGSPGPPEKGMPCGEAAVHQVALSFDGLGDVSKVIHRTPPGPSGRSPEALGRTARNRDTDAASHCPRSGPSAPAWCRGTDASERPDLPA